MLRGFVAVARRMSITQAADDLCLTQSAVSRQVQALEEFFAAPLLVRRYRAVALTPLGEELFALVSPFFVELGEFASRARQPLRPQTVTVTASIGITALWILQRLGAFQAAHERIDVRVAANDRVLDMRHEGIDLAIRYARADAVPAQSIRLFGEQIVPVAAPAVARQAFATEEALFDQILLEFDEGGRPWLHWADWLEQRHPGRKPKGFLYFNQYDQIIHAAIEGHGVALGRVGLILPQLADGRLVAAPTATPADNDYAYWLIRASDTPRPEVLTFAEWLRGEAARTEAGLASHALHASGPR